MIGAAVEVGAARLQFAILVLDTPAWGRLNASAVSEMFLASDMARYVTGAALLVDGGAFVNLQ